MSSPTAHRYIRGALTGVERMRSSRNGNPRYRCRIGDDTYQTPPDSQIAYTLPSLEGSTVEAHVGPYYGKPTLWHCWTVTEEES